MVENVSMQQVSRPFLDFVLAHARITTHVCTRQLWPVGYVLPQRSIVDYNYVFVRSGSVVWTVEGDPWRLDVGDLAVVTPGKRHHARCVGGPLVLGSVHVDVKLPGGADVFDLLQPAAVRHVAAGTRLDGYLAGAIGEWERQDVQLTRLMLPGWARLITLELISRDAELGLLRQRSLHPLVVATLNELNQRIDRPTTLADLATWSGFSAQYLNRVFRGVLGVTPLQYLTKIRMERAAKMLADRDSTVRGVARRVGFHDPSYFSRVFTHYVGRTPSQYRVQAEVDA